SDREAEGKVRDRTEGWIRGKNSYGEGEIKDIGTRKEKERGMAERRKDVIGSDNEHFPAVSGAFMDSPYNGNTSLQTSTSNLNASYSRPSEAEDDGKVSSDTIWLWIAVLATIGNIVVVAVLNVPEGSVSLEAIRAVGADCISDDDFAD
ncbi:hypothetical protein INR49_018601, partial [Caranx melampygus]